MRGSLAKSPTKSPNSNSSLSPTARAFVSSGIYDHNFEDSSNSNEFRKSYQPEVYHYNLSEEDLKENLTHDYLYENYDDADTQVIIRIMQYNILAECYATLDNFPYVNPRFLEWEFRFDMIVQQILTIDADVICLQEVESDLYFERLSVILEKRGGYLSIYKKRPYHHKKDGCAIFFKEGKLEIITKTELSYNSLAKDISAGDRAQTNNIAIGIYFQEISPLRRRFWVINTHLFWDPKAPDVKLGQAKMLKKFIYSQLQRSPGGVIICGDFNSTPESDVCHYMLEDGLFDSAFDLDYPSHTNITPGFCNCIDYIWYTIGEFNVHSAVDLKTSLGNSVYIPDESHPSDHLPLIADFTFREDSVKMMSRHGASEKCKYDLLCRRQNCKYSHTLLCSSGIDCPIKEECRYAHVVPCRFGVSCFKDGCKFNHLPCKFGSHCTNPSCMYSH